MSSQEAPQGPEVWFLNRGILVVRPAEPFLSWASELPAEEGEEPFDPETALEWKTAFLVPEFDTEEETWDWVEAHCTTVFEMQLADWHTDPATWPENRGWDTFAEWFEMEFIEIAWDLVDEPLSSEPPSGPVIDA